MIDEISRASIFVMRSKGAEDCYPQWEDSMFIHVCQGERDWKFHNTLYTSGLYGGESAYRAAGRYGALFALSERALLSDYVGTVCYNQYINLLSPIHIIRKGEYNFLSRTLELFCTCPALEDMPPGQNTLMPFGYTPDHIERMFQENQIQMLVSAPFSSVYTRYYEPHVQLALEYRHDVGRAKEIYVYVREQRGTSGQRTPTTPCKDHRQNDLPCDMPLLAKQAGKPCSRFFSNFPFSNPRKYFLTILISTR